VKRYFILSLLLIFLNLLFALYALREWRAYSEKFILYRKLVKENLLLTKEVEKFLNYEELSRFARRRGFRDVKPEDVEGFREFLEKSPKSAPVSSDRRRR